VKKVPHAVLGNDSMRCLNCGTETPIGMPASIRTMTAMCQAFSDDHEHCEPSAAGRARFEYTTPIGWLRSWDTGASSLTIFHFMTGGIYGALRVDIPHDPDDFGRCHRLLKTFPEWRVRLDEMKRIPDWVPFVEAWAEFERLFELEAPTGTCPQLYEAMQVLRA